MAGSLGMAHPPTPNDVIPITLNIQGYFACGAKRGPPESP